MNSSRCTELSQTKITRREFIRKSEKVGFYVLDHDFSYSLSEKKPFKGNVLKLNGRFFLFRYVHLPSFRFIDAQFDDDYERAYRYLLDSVAQEVIDA